MNSVVLIGRITKNIELQRTQSGNAMCKFTLAVNRKQNETDFINCIAWNKTAELMNTYLSKGSLVGVLGRIQTGSYRAKDGRTVYTFDVAVNELQFLEPKQKEEPRNEEVKQIVQEVVQDESFEIDSDDLPF